MIFNRLLPLRSIFLGLCTWKMILGNLMSHKRYRLSYTNVQLCVAIILVFIPGMGPSVLKQSIKRFISGQNCPNNIIDNIGKKFISQETGVSK